MSDVVSPDLIEGIVGVPRHPIDHIARAVTAEDTVYVLHSQECLDSGIDLRECAYSRALDAGIDADAWGIYVDRAAPVEIVDGRLVPWWRTAHMRAVAAQDDGDWSANPAAVWAEPMTDERLAEIRALDAAADRGPWRWHGNTDYPEGLSLENREWVILGLTRRERQPDDRAIRQYAHYLLDDRTFVTPQEQDTLTGVEVDRLNEERALDRAREEMLTDANGEPAYDVRLRFGGDDRTTAGLAEDLAVYEVCRAATTRDDPRVYRADVVGFRNPNATFIEHARQAVTDLLAEVDRLRAQIDDLA